MATNNGGCSQLPEDVIVEILSWLPVKALLRFKCVCKSWYSIVKSSDLIFKHLENYYNSCDGCLLAHFQPDTIELFPDETLEDLSHQPLHLPFLPTAIFGPCNGIYYLDTGLFSDGDGALWNPATKELHLLPAKLTEPDLPPSPDVPGFDYPAFLSARSSSGYETGLPPYLARICDAYGFGFDYTTKDFKVVVVRILWDYARETRYYPSSVILYSLRSNSWRYCGGLAQHCYLIQSACYTYVNGIFYWLGSGTLGMFILSFDFNKDSFDEIPVPDYPWISYDETLALYHDSIALFFIHMIDKFIDIWVIDDERNWTKKFTIAPLSEIHRPVGQWKNGKVFLQSRTSSRTSLLCLCDPSTQEVRNLGFHAFPESYELFIYKESLVSIKDMKCMQDLEQ